MSKLNLRICGCGRLHFYDSEIEYEAIRNNKEIILICSKCGEVLHIGADEEPDYYETEKTCYNMYSYVQEKENITKDSFDKIHQIIIDDGNPVFMATGYYANTYINHKFYDYDSQFDRIRRYTTLIELEKDLDDYSKKRETVVPHVLLNSLTEDQKEVFSHYWFEQFSVEK